MKYVNCIIVVAVGLLMAGCATSSIPKGARAVGGGLRVSWSSPESGTAFLVEQTTHKIVATENVGTGTFDFDVSHGRDAEVLRAIFPNSLPTNAVFVLYFLPDRREVAK